MDEFYADRIRLVPAGSRVPLQDCPPGLFLLGNSLCYCTRLKRMWEISTARPIIPKRMPAVTTVTPLKYVLDSPVRGIPQPPAQVLEFREKMQQLHRRAQAAESQVHRLRSRYEAQAHNLEVAARRLNVNASWLRRVALGESQSQLHVTCWGCRWRQRLAVWWRKRRWRRHVPASRQANFLSSEAEDFVRWNRNQLDRRIDALRHELAALEIQRAKESLKEEEEARNEYERSIRQKPTAS